MYGPADVTGTMKSTDVTLSVTVKGSTAHFTGKVTSQTTMNGTVTGTSDKPRKWTAEKKPDQTAVAGVRISPWPLGVRCLPG